MDSQMKAVKYNTKSTMLTVMNDNKFLWAGKQPGAQQQPEQQGLQVWHSRPDLVVFWSELLAFFPM